MFVEYSMYVQYLVVGYQATLVSKVERLGDITLGIGFPHADEVLDH